MRLTSCVCQALSTCIMIKVFCSMSQAPSLLSIGLFVITLLWILMLWMSLSGFLKKVIRKGTKMNSIITGIKFVGLVGLVYASLIVLTALFITSWWQVDNGWLAFVGAGACLTGSVVLLEEFLRAWERLSCSITRHLAANAARQRRNAPPPNGIRTMKCRHTLAIRLFWKRCIVIDCYGMVKRTSKSMAISVHWIAPVPTPIEWLQHLKEDNHG